MRIAAAVFALVLMPHMAAAQDGLRSASLPELVPSSPVPTERDLYRVPPDFYSRRPDPDGSRLFFPYGGLPPYPPYPYWSFPPPYDIRGNGSRNSEIQRADFENAGRATAAPVAVPPIVPGKPKTIYVIPGCYAGDKPPRPEWLPRGCDRSRMRVIPPA